ncbi:hypothetical protein ACI1JY_001682 [Campylobacter upsaliensis]
MIMLDDSKIKQNYKNIHKELLSLYEEQKKDGANKRQYNRYCVEDTELFESFIMLRLIDDDNTNLTRKIHLIEVYRQGYKYIRRINEKLAFKQNFDEDDFSFLKALEMAEAYSALSLIYDDDELKIINKQFKKGLEK